MTSRYMLSLAILALLCACAVPFVQAEVVIPTDMVGQIEAITAKSYNLYPVDQVKTETLYANIDRWAQSQITLDDASQAKSPRSSRLTWVKVASQNTPILAGDNKGEGLVLSGPFRIKYVKKSLGRALVKFLRVPTKKSLKKERVAELARQFIQQQGFVAQTHRDKLGRHLVVNRLSRSDLKGEGKSGLKLTILQRAVMKRQLDGLEVLNSKLVVDLHPDSMEVLAFKHLYWAPADEASGKHMPSISRDEAVAAIQQAFGQSNRKVQVTAVKAGMYQATDSIVPVLAVQVQRVSEDQAAATWPKVLLVPLVKDVSLPGREGVREYPSANAQ
jgi:hypothetical protein